MRLFREIRAAPWQSVPVAAYHVGHGDAQETQRVADHHGPALIVRDLGVAPAAARSHSSCDDVPPAPGDLSFRNGRHLVLPLDAIAVEWDLLLSIS
jgi:hypothetical protein